MKLTDIKFKPAAPPVALDRSVTVMPYERDEGKVNQKSWMVEIDGERFEVGYTTTVTVQNAHRSKRNRQVIIDQQGYLRKLS